MGARPAIGNSGPLPDHIASAVKDNALVVAAVFERKPQFRGADQSAGARKLPGLASAGCRLCVGRKDGHRPQHRAAWAGQRAESPSISATYGPRRKKFIAPSIHQCAPRCFRKAYEDRFRAMIGGRLWSPSGELYRWDDESTYVKRRLSSTNMPRQPRL